MPLAKKRSLLLHGLQLVLLNIRAVLWTGTASLFIAIVFSLRPHAQLGSLLNKSLGAERLNSAFDVGTALNVIQRLQHNAPEAGLSSYAGQPIYFLLSLVLVPGALFCFHTEAPATLRMLVTSGLKFFWRFVRIALLTLAFGLVLVALPTVLAGVLTSRIQDAMVGWPALWLNVGVWAVVLLLASLLRLYFDLVEAYTMLLDDQIRPNGLPDRRVRRTLGPVLGSLFRNFARAYGTFLLLLILGLAAFLLLGRVALHMLAQPRVWPMFLLAQTGLLLMLFCRFWQRGAAMSLALQNPLESQPVNPYLVNPHDDGLVAVPVSDPVPDPEPISPSLDGPDPGIYEPELEPAPAPQPPPVPYTET